MRNIKNCLRNDACEYMNNLIDCFMRKFSGMVNCLYIHEERD